MSIMPSFWLWLVVSLKAMVEVAALSLLAQGMLRILAGKSYRDNFVYRLFQVVTAPVLVLVRKLTPPFIGGAYLGLVAFLLLGGLWLALVYVKVQLCQTAGAVCFSG
ncbi:MAG: hypothetical protein AB1722_11320 [Pseudomonadota bacterium]